MGRVSKSFALLLVSMFLIVSLAATTFAEQGGGDLVTTLVSPSQTKNTITLLWTPFPTREQNWIFIGYEVFCLKSPDGYHSFWQSCWKSAKYASPQVNVTIISGLSPNTTYYFKVVPYGFDSYGHNGFPASNTLDVETQPTTTPSPTPSLTPAPTPTVPEFSWLIVLPLFVILLFVELKFKSKSRIFDLG